MRHAVFVITDTDAQMHSAHSLVRALRELGFAREAMWELPLKAINTANLKDARAVFITGESHLYNPPALPSCIFESKIPVLATDFGFIALAAHFGEPSFSGRFGYRLQYCPAVRNRRHSEENLPSLLAGVRNNGVWMSNLVLEKAPKEFKVIARNEHNHAVTAMQHIALPVYAVQYQLHGPTQFAMHYCATILRNFLAIAGVPRLDQDHRSLVPSIAAE